MSREFTPSPIEVRFSTIVKGGRTFEEFDEIVARDCVVHLEKMDDGFFALMIYTRTEEACFHIFAKAARGHVDAIESWRNQANRRSEAQRRRWAQPGAKERHGAKLAARRRLQAMRKGTR